MIDWQPLIVAIVAATPPTIVALAAYRKSQEVHLLVNSRMDELLRMSGMASHAAGVLEERQRERSDDPN